MTTKIELVTLDYLQTFVQGDLDAAGLGRVEIGQTQQGQAWKVTKIVFDTDSVLAPVVRFYSGAVVPGNEVAIKSPIFPFGVSDENPPIVILDSLSPALVVLVGDATFPGTALASFSVTIKYELCLIIRTPLDARAARSFDNFFDFTRSTLSRDQLQSVHKPEQPVFVPTIEDAIEWYSRNVPIESVNEE